MIEGGGADGRLPFSRGSYWISKRSVWSFLPRLLRVTSCFALLFSSVARLVFAGVLLGAIFAIAVRVWIESLLGGYGNNPAALFLAGALLSTVAMMAALIPARSAMNVEPMVALRNE
jgi:hypothetical protein